MNSSTLVDCSASCLEASNTTSITLPNAPLRNRLDRLGKGPLSFWFLNHQLEKGEMARQLRELKDKGFSGVFLHPRGGLLEPYGSSHWYEAVGFCIAEARRIGMEAWLYDEDPYPSGAAGGRVIFENPGLRASRLEHRTLEARGPGRYQLDLPPGALVAAYIIRGSEIQRIDQHAGIIRANWSQYHTTNSYHASYRIDGAPHWRAATEDPFYRIVINLEEASSPAHIVGFVRVYTQQSPWGAYPDLLNPKSVEAFVRCTHHEYYSHFGESFGETVPGIFTDEAKLHGALPWSETLAPLFNKISGLDLMSVLPHLVKELSPQTPFIRWAYREASAQGLEKYFIKPLKEACRSCDLLFTGHISPEENPLSQAIMAPGLMRLLAAMDIPGTDFIGSTFGNALHPLLHLSPKLVSSAAHADSKPFVACEAFAVAGWSQDFAFLTRVAHWLFALGVNRLVTHGQFYSIDGLRKREAPPSQFFQASYWQHFRPYSDSITYLTEQLTQGSHEAPILLYYPEESFMAVSFTENGAFASQTQSLQDNFGDLLHCLLVRGYDFDLADSSILSKAVPCDGSISIADEIFQAIVVPGCHLSESTWHLLQRFQELGLKVYFVESEVTILSADPHKVALRGYPIDLLLKELEKCIIPLWKCEEGELIGHQRSTPSGPLLFLCNNGDDEFNGTTDLNFAGPYEVCDPNKGSVWERADEPLYLEIPPGLGLLIRPSQAPLSRFYVSKDEWRPLAVEWLGWKAKADSENCLVLHQFQMISQSKEKGIHPLPSVDLLTMAPVIDLLSPSSLACQTPDPREDRILMTSFDWHCAATPLRMVCDTDFSLCEPSLGDAAVEFLLNGQLVPRLERRHTFDPMNREADLTSLVRRGRNIFTLIQRGVSSLPHLPWPYDGVRLFGDFHVDLPHGNLPPAVLTPRPEYYPCGEPISPGQLGHPHYGGLFLYQATFRLPFIPQRISLRFRKVYETMEVILNGQSVGHLWAAPYILEINPDVLKEGINEMSLRCSTSPANYLQTLNLPAGALGPVEWCFI